MQPSPPPISRTLSSPREEILYPLVLTLQSLFFLVSDNHSSTSVSLDLFILHISYKWTDTMCGLLCLVSFTGHNVFKVHSSCSTNQYFFLWLRTISLYWFTTHSFIGRHFHCLYFLAVMNILCGLNFFFPFSSLPLSLSFSFWCMYLGVEFLGCVVCVLSCVWLFSTPWTVAHQAPSPWDFSGKTTGVGCHFLLHGIFLT